MDGRVERTTGLARAEPEAGAPRPARSPLARGLWIATGVVCVALGLLGIVLPGLPTTPFLLLAAACFARGSERLYRWLLEHRTLGPFVRDFRAGKGVSLRVKAWALGVLALFIGIALGPGLPAGMTWLRIVVGVCALIGATCILRVPTRP